MLKTDVVKRTLSHVPEKVKNDLCIEFLKIEECGESSAPARSETGIKANRVFFESFKNKIRLPTIYMHLLCSV